MYSKIQYISQGRTGAEQLTNIMIALDHGVDWIQLRLKNSAPTEISRIGQEVARRCAAYGARFILNDHMQLVKEVGADGVHLGLTDGEISAARSMLGTEVIIGGTANTVANVRQRIQEGCDYIGLGPFRFTETKAVLSPILGLAGYQEIFRQLAVNDQQPVVAGKICPIYAIGGIELEDIPALIDTGVYGVALSRYLTTSAPIGTTTSFESRQLKKRINLLKKTLYV